MNGTLVVVGGLREGGWEESKALNDLKFFRLEKSGIFDLVEIKR
jgi:hypothetical protein